MNPLHRFVFRFLRWNRVASLLLAICLLSSSTPAAPQTIVAIAREQRINFAFWYHSSGLAKAIQGRGAPQPRPQERQADRDAKVVRLEIHPSNVSVDLAERVRFVAVGYDGNGNAVGGVKVRWTAEAATAGQRARISRQGEFHPVAPGVFTVTAQAAGKSAQTTVTVRPGLRPNLNLPPTSTRQVSSRDLPTARISSTKEPKNSGKGSARNSQRPGKGELAKRSHASKAVSTSAPAPMPQSGGGGWDSSNYWSADDPENRVGDPPGMTPDGGAGSGNFQFDAPIYNAPGRGTSISLGLSYNSRLWNKAGTQMSYDNDRSWPAPGFNLGFGKLLGMTINTGCMLVDANGTRHGYSGNITFYNWGTHGVMHTTDGSFIDYTYTTGTNGVITSAQAKLPNGTIINYGAYSQAGGGVFPTSIIDANGNFIYITYVNNAGPRIQTVTDTLGRVINFHYDPNNLLTAITAPGLDGGTRTLVRLHYRQLSLNYGFSWPQIQSTVVSNPTPWVLDAIFYPATGTGYWLYDSYSSYGMLANVIEQRGMTFSQSPLNDMGTVYQGTLTRQEEYNYDLTPNYGLTDAPTYTTLTERWTPDGSGLLNEAVTAYEVHENDNPRTTTITLPNLTKTKQFSYNAPGSYLDGLVYRDITFTSDEANPLQESTSIWEQGAYSSPRPTRVEKFDERRQKTATQFSYGSVYNQVTDVRDYDYGGTALLRSIRTVYQNSANYTNRHLFNLPLSVEIYAADDVTRVSRTDYQYDGQTLTDAPNVVMHDEASNPYAQTQESCDWVCYEYDPWWVNCINSQWVCNYYNPYDPSTDYRGNVTQVTTYADANNLTGAVTETRRYDKTGNMVNTSTSCCEQTTFDYTVNTQYAYPESQTRGSATDQYAQVTTSTTYDFNTGVTLIATDENGRPSITDYDANTLRPSRATSPTGAHTDYEYDEAAMSVTQTTYLETHPNHNTTADKNKKLLNGRGQVRQEQALGPNSIWDLVDIFYDNMGNVIEQTHPYRSGETPQKIISTYDALGRNKTVTMPGGSLIQIFYNEISRPDVASTAPGETTRVQDAWGRERWGRKDASGRLVEVVEPIPSGNGSVGAGMVTNYTYNTLGNLTQVNQGAQTRWFKYDSIGRLTAQKLAEANATLNDAGVYVGEGAWSDVFTYDQRSNLGSRTDARGVKTIYSYNNDPLNRLQSVSWDTSGFGDSPNPILAAATVTYSYRAKTYGAQLLDVTEPAGVSTAGISTESYGFDDEGRVSSKTVTLTNRPNYAFVTDFNYDSLDRVWRVWYPAEYGNGGTRKTVDYTYDIASRLNGLTFNGQTQASNIIYNAASQTTSFSVGAGTNQVNENYGYDAHSGLIESQTVTRNGSTLLNLSYDYAGVNGKRTGQLTKIYNNLDHAKDRSYEYDALGRLVQASGGVNGALWTQTYSYDRYGNRTSVSASGYSAKSETTVGSTSTFTASRTKRRTVDMSAALVADSIPHPSEPKVELPTELIARNNSIDVPAFLRDESKPLSDSPPTLYSPAAPQSGSKIAFASNRDGSAQIYLMNTDGTDQTRLTSNEGNDDAPRWSPNNSKILFQSDRDNPFCAIFDIYTMNADGSGQTRLTTDINDDSAPVWSPDGTKIAFQSMRNGAKYQIYVMNADGTGQTNISNSAANDTEPSWSPDGTKIAFSSDRDSSTGQSDVYVMNSNGSTQTRLTFTNDPFTDSQPSWSVDGLKLAFTSTRDSTIETWTETDDFEIPDDDGQTFPRSRLNINKEVYVMNANGSGQTRLTNTLENDETPAWSSDGSKIVFRSDRERDNYDPVAQIWVMNPDGTAQTNLSSNECGDSCPSWQNFSSNLPPTVSITAPANGAGFTAPGNVNITTNAGDSDGTVSRVDFYQGSTLLGTDTSAPYSFSWNSVAAGSYPLTAKATDNGGATTTSSAVNITVNSLPSVTVSSPANGASFTAPANINITANANDTDGTISSVQFFHGATSIGTDTSAPYSVNWNNVVSGNYALTARATDSGGATTTSAVVNITVNTNGAPTVSITAPANGASFTAPANVSITANAADSDGIVTSVEFYQGTTLLGTDSSAPYAFNWSNVAAGNYSLTAKATDNGGTPTTSMAVSITVNPDQPPTVSITGPANGSTHTAPASINIAANASDTDGTVSSVEFYQGATLIGTDTAAPYSLNWNNVAAGNYSLTAKAIDNAGGTTTSQSVNVIVNAASVPIPRDGQASLSYDTASNRITTAGFEYDAAGNQVRALIPGNSTMSQRFQYDAANRLVKVKADDNVTVNASHTYGADNQRLVSEEFAQGTSTRTYYVAEGLSVIAEYAESGGATNPIWAKSYVYFGERLLSTATPNGGGGHSVQYHHSDRLGTRLVTDPANGGSFEQITLPFGTALSAESTGATNRRFTSYDRSTTTGVDYAVNRHYDSQQGRFTQVDPIGMASVTLESPQTLNLYAYCANDPINHIDPSGLGFLSFLKKVFAVIAKIFKVIIIIAAVVLAIVGTLAIAGALLPYAGVKFGLIALGLSAAGFALAFGPPWLQKTISVGFAILGIYLMQPQAIWNIEQTSQTARSLRRLAGTIMTIGSVSTFLAPQRGPKKVTTIDDRGRRVEVKPNEPTDVKREVRVPTQQPRGKLEAHLPKNATRWERFKFATASVLKILDKYLNKIVIMVDPAVLAEIACKEDPGGAMCRDFIIFLPPEKRCRILRCS